MIGIHQLKCIQESKKQSSLRLQCRRYNRDRTPICDSWDDSNARKRLEKNCVSRCNASLDESRGLPGFDRLGLRRLKSTQTVEEVLPGESPLTSGHDCRRLAGRRSVQPEDEHVVLGMDVGIILEYLDGVRPLTHSIGEVEEVIAVDLVKGGLVHGQREDAFITYV